MNKKNSDRSHNFQANKRSNLSSHNMFTNSIFIGLFIPSLSQLKIKTIKIISSNALKKLF